jgi:hypothetical protein
MLRPFFCLDRDLLKDWFHLAHDCLLEYLRATRHLPAGLPGIVLAIRTFGEYLDLHPHLHALVADALFVRAGLFHVLLDASLKPLEDLFQARVIALLVDKSRLPPTRVVQQQDARPARQASRQRGSGRRPSRADHRRLRPPTPPNPVGQVARAHQEGVGG